MYTFGIFTQLKFPLPTKLEELASTPTFEEPFKIGSDADDEKPAFFTLGIGEEVSGVGEPETAIPICPRRDSVFAAVTPIPLLRVKAFPFAEGPLLLLRPTVVFWEGGCAKGVL